MNLLPASHPVLVRTGRRAAQAGVVLLVYYFILIGGFAAGMREYKWRMITLVMLCLLLGGWFLWRVLNQIDVPSTKLEYPLLMMLVASALSTFFSTEPRLSAGRLLINITLAISLYFMFDWMRNERRAQLFINATLLTGGIVCIIGFVELWQWYDSTWISPLGWREAGLTWSLSNSLRIKSVLHSPNGLAYFLVPIAGLTFYKLSQTTTIWQRGLLGIYLALVLVTAILTQSRGGLLGLFTTTAVFVALFMWSRVGKGLAERRGRLVSGALGGILLILMLSLLIPVIIRTDLRLVSALNLRDDIWTGAMRIFLAHPISGAGPATFPTQYMIYRNQAGHNAVFVHAHNVWLTISAEYGIVGVLSVIWFFVMLGIAVFSYLRRVEPGQWSGMALAGVSILAGQGVHNLFDDFMEFPIFTWFTVLGIVLCLHPICAQRPMLSAQKRRIWALLVGGGLLIVFWGALWCGRAFAAYDQARQAAQANDWPQAVSRLERAVELDPKYRFYRQQLALAYGELARSDDSYLPMAFAQQKLAFEQSSSYPPDGAYLACLYWQLGQPERAIELMRTVISITPSETGGFYSYHLGPTTFYFNLGYYLESVGETDLAQQAYARVLLAFPQVGTSSYWQVSDGQRQMLQTSARIAQQLTNDKNLEAEIAFYSGDYQTALELFATPPVDQIGQAKSLLALGQVKSAGQLLATNSHQSSARPLPYQARVLAAGGDFAQAETYIRKAIALLPKEPSYYYHWGHLAELQGDTSLAIDSYLRAIALSTAIRTDYANLVGHRQPLPAEQPFCLMFPYPAENLSKPSLALANILIAQNQPSQAMVLYQNLLRHEPYNLEAQRRLRELVTTYPTFQPESPPDPSQ